MAALNTYQAKGNSMAVRMLVAIDSFVNVYEGVEYSYRQDETRVKADDPRIQGFLHLFKPIEASYLDVEAATQGPGERRGQ